jgi:hypothetical protein
MRQSPDDLSAYLAVLAADAGAGQLLEVRYRRSRGMGQRFFAVDRLGHAAGEIHRLGRHQDTYVGVLTRDQASGGRGAILTARLLWAEVDDPDARALLQRAPQPPTMVLASGSPGHLHAYWRMEASIPADQVEAANRRLGACVGADLACVDRARILRPPGTLNFKRSPAQPVELVSFHADRRYGLGALIDGLEDPEPAIEPTRRNTTAHRSPSRPGHPTGDVDAQLRGISAAEYIARLSGRRADREGKVLCPFHAERTPSLQAYPDGSWCCFGCGRGGSIFDFAACRWGMGTKGREFIALRDRLTDELLGRPAPAPGTQALTTPRRPMGSNQATQEVTR